MERQPANNGFTLVEMLLVIGILGILMAVLIGNFMSAPAKAEKAKCQELVSNAATALSVYLTQQGCWPQALIANHNAERGLDATAAYPLASHGYYSASYDDGSVRLKGADRLGLVSPWAAAVIKDRGSSVSDSTPVPSGGTIASHRFRYAIDLDGDGIIDGASIGGGSVDIRATAAVWCAGRDGKIESYQDGQRSDDVYSWAYGQTQSVK